VVVLVFCRVLWKLWLRNVVFWHGKRGVDRGGCVAGNATNFVDEKYATFFNFIFECVLPDGLPAREAVTS
jgi:hypothetical protein